MKQSDHIKVSILIPTYNRERFIINAIKSALLQEEENIEIIVGVNGCTDNTLALVSKLRDPRLRIQAREIPIPMYDNFNALVEEAKGEYLLMLSDDDILKPQALKILLDTISNQPEAEIVIGAVKIVYQNGGNKSPRFRPKRDRSSLSAILDYLRGNIAVYPCGTLLSSNALREIGSYDYNRFGLAADVAAWMHVANRKGIVAYCDKQIADYMVHSGNETVVSNLEKWKNALTGIQKALESIDYPENFDKCRVFKELTKYRAECIGRSQSQAISRGEPSFDRIVRGLLTLIYETKDTPPHTRIKVILLWAARIIKNTLKKPW